MITNKIPKERPRMDPFFQQLQQGAPQFQRPAHRRQRPVCSRPPTSPAKERRKEAGQGSRNSRQAPPERFQPLNPAKYRKRRHRASRGRRTWASPRPCRGRALREYRPPLRSGPAPWAVPPIPLARPGAAPRRRRSRPAAGPGMAPQPPHPPPHDRESPPLQNWTGALHKSILSIHKSIYEQQGPSSYMHSQPHSRYILPYIRYRIKAPRRKSNSP